MDRMAPYHFAVEVEDWDGFLAHLDEVGIRHTRVITRPENNSQFCYIHEPDHTLIELVLHARRPAWRPRGSRRRGGRPLTPLRAVLARAVLPRAGPPRRTRLGASSRRRK